MRDTQNVDFLYNKLENKEPFCFIKLNDGEVAIIDNPTDKNVVVSRGDQTTCELLSEKLKECLNWQHENYFVGIPCCGCAGAHREIAKKHLSDTTINVDDHPNFLNANILINSNVNRTLDVLQNIFSNKQKHVIVVTNPELNANIDKLIQFGITPSRVILVENRNAFNSHYEVVKDEWTSFPDNSYVLCLCGPLGRVLCYEWFKNNSTFTCLELGSIFDPILKNRSYSYHQDTLPPCQKCSPVKLDYKSFSNVIPDYYKLQTEVFYLNSIPEYFHFYGHDIDKIFNSLRFRFKDDLNNSTYQQWLSELNEIMTGKLIQYKKMSKSGMFNEMVDLYNKKNMHEMKLISELYLEYFGRIFDTNTRVVKFYNGLSNLSVNQSKSIQIFENLLKDVDLEKDTRDYIEKYLKKFYTIQEDSIPKIIHLIYFKERDLCAYHLRCVKSIIKHMPDYKIIIHNDVEPHGNECWDALKQIEQIEIRSRERPREFDGFPLYYVQYQADVARLEILYEFGGIYLDLDVLVIRNFEELFNDKCGFYICKEGAEGPGVVSGLINSFLASKPKNEFLKIWLDNFKTGLRMDSWAYHIRDTNKKLVDDNPHYIIKYGIKVLNHHHFFPFPWFDRDAFENKREIIFEDTTYGIHLFDTILHGVLVNNEFFPNV
jgi:hypothetical protein